MYVLVLRPYRKDNIYFRTIEEREKINKINFVDIEMAFFFLGFPMKKISTINNCSYTSQIHCRNALRLDPVIFTTTKNNSGFDM